MHNQPRPIASIKNARPEKSLALHISSQYLDAPQRQVDRRAFDGGSGSAGIRGKFTFPERAARRIVRLFLPMP